MALDDIASDPAGVAGHTHVVDVETPTKYL